MSPRFKRLRIDLHSLANLLQAIHHHTLARFNAFTHNPVVTACFAEPHGANAHFVAGVDYRDQAAALEFHHGTLRDKQGSRLNSGSTYPPVLARPQAIPGVWEQSHDADGASPYVHLAVCKRKLALERIGGAIGQN